MSLASGVSTVGKVDGQVFQHDFRRLDMPIVMKRQSADWLSVSSALISDQPVAEYMKQLDNGVAAGTNLADPAFRSAFFSGEDCSFRSGELSNLAATDRLIKVRESAIPHNVIVQSAQIGDRLPGFHDDDDLALLPQGSRLQCRLASLRAPYPHQTTVSSHKPAFGTHDDPSSQPYAGGYDCAPSG